MYVGQPEMVQCSYDGLRKLRALFSWEMPRDDGGFPITDYDLSLSISGVTQPLITWTLGRPLRSDHVVNDSDILVFRVSAVNTLGPGEACQVDKTVPTSERSYLCGKCKRFCFLFRKVYQTV